MTQSKLMTLAEAISRFVSDGSSIALGTAQETLIPFAAGHEIIRQCKRDLTLIGPISDILFDQMIGAGCVKKVRAAWVGNVITGSGYNFRQAIESGELEMEDHSNLTLAMGLRAGALGVPFLPTYTALGSDLRLTNHHLKTVTCPFTGRILTAVAAINPDVAIIHVQRADIYGNAHAWGNLGVTREACQAAGRVILTCEEIVSSQLIQSDPNRVIVPGLRVAAVVHAPWGAHPSPVPGFYNRDHEVFQAYQEASKTPDAFAEWLAGWIDGVQRAENYPEFIGVEKRNELALKVHAPSRSVDYGY
ncbi:MAG TPA: CoA-transferase [Anaerolineales bacterium]|nr:CoA-transferase [Anaerolineales bacterium]